MNEEEKLIRWRLILGADENDGTACTLSDDLIEIDRALGSLYDSTKNADLSKSSPNVNRWLGDIRTYFPSSVVQVMQKDAMERLNMKQLLLEKEMLENIQPDVHLVATLMTLKNVIPDKTKETARMVVQLVVNELLQKLTQPMIQAIKGSINRSIRNNNPKLNEMNWHKTILKNLKHYQPEHKTIIPETKVGYGRKRSSLKDIILCLDQSGSMGTSVVYSGIFGSVMSSVPAIKTQMVVFDTEVVDLTEDLQDPVDLLFGVQLGGGTDIHKALSYCHTIITKPADTILILISDLYEGGNVDEMQKKALDILASGVQMIILLALSDNGAPAFDAHQAHFFAEHGVPVFACTPDKFPDLMAAALQKQDLHQWAAKENISLKQ